MIFKSRYSFSVLMVSVLLLPSKADAEIYKCENIKKEIFYNDKPCPVLDEETEIPAVKDIKNGYVFPAFVSDENKKNKGLVIKQKNIRITKTKIKDKDGKDIEGGGKNEDNKFIKAKGVDNGGNSVASTLNNDPVVSSAGRKSEGTSSRTQFDDKKRYIMKVEQNTREPR
jgi:hypothetical protein